MASRELALAAFRLLLPAAVAVVATGAHGGIPEPDAVFYGEVRLDGAVQTAGQVELRRSGKPSVFATIAPRSVAGPPIYLLRVRLETDATPIEGVGQGASQVGDSGFLYLHANAGEFFLNRIVLQGRGRVTRLDVDAPSAPSDRDGDTIPDRADNCSAIENADQVDSDLNGIGAACDAHEGAKDPDNPDPVFAFVGEVDNTADPSTGRGSVPHSYEIGATEVTNWEYAEFLDAVAADDPNELFTELMERDPRGGILRVGSVGGYRYQLKPNMAGKPVNFVSWIDAARFANWLENGGPEGAQGPGTTETGAFDLTVADPGLGAIENDLAAWSLPTEDEWYKAAYYDPAARTYSSYATGGDEPPKPATADPTGEVADPGSSVIANYAEGAVWNGQPNVVTVGQTSPSRLGTADQGGNVAEWLAEPSEGGLRIARGGGFDSQAVDLTKTQRLSLDPALESPGQGFRVVRIRALESDPDGDGWTTTCPDPPGERTNCPDNCSMVANPDQADVDAGQDDDKALEGIQHYGDACDADLDNDGIVGASDFFTVFRPCFGASLDARPECERADLDHDGVVGASDFFGVLRPQIGRVPGPGSPP